MTGLNAPGSGTPASFNPDLQFSQTSPQREITTRTGAVTIGEHQAPELQSAQVSKPDPTAQAQTLSEEMGGHIGEKVAAKQKEKQKSMKERGIKEVNAAQKMERFSAQHIREKAGQFCRGFTNVNQQVLENAINDLIKKRNRGPLTKEDLLNFAAGACRGKDPSTKVFLLNWMKEDFFKGEADPGLTKAIEEARDEVIDTEIGGSAEQKKATLGKARQLHTQLAKSRGVVQELGMTHKEIDAGLRMFLGEFKDTSACYTALKEGHIPKKGLPGRDFDTMPPLSNKAMMSLFKSWTHLTGSILRGTPPPPHALINDLQQLRQDMNNVVNLQKFMGTRLEGVVASVVAKGIG